MGRRSNEKKNKVLDTIVLNPVARRRVADMQAQLNLYLISQRDALKVPESWQYDPQRFAFSAPPEKEKGD